MNKLTKEEARKLYNELVVQGETLKMQNQELQERLKQLEEQKAQLEVDMRVKDEEVEKFSRIVRGEVPHKVTSSRFSFFNHIKFGK